MARRTPPPRGSGHTRAFADFGGGPTPCPRTPSPDTGPTLLQVLQRPNPPISDGWAGTSNSYGSTQPGGDNFDVVVMEEEYPSVQQWTDFTFPAIQLAYGHLLEEKMQALESKYRAPLTPSPGQKVGEIVDKSSFDGYGRDWTRHIVRAPIRNADKRLRPMVSSNAGTATTSALRHRCIEWRAPNDKKVRLKPDWAAVDGDVEVVYEETHPDDRIPKPLVYAVGQSISGQKWKSEWLAMRSDAQVLRHPAINIIPPLPIASERLLPLKQVATYCRYAETRYSFIFTQRELVALRIRRIPTPGGMSFAKHYPAVEYAPVPMTATTGLTANLAIWVLACLGMNDGHRAMEGPGNRALDFMARLTWWKFDGIQRVYVNVVSKRRIHESQWKPEEYGQFVHLTEKDGKSDTEAFLPTQSISNMERLFESAMRIAKDAQPSPPLRDNSSPSAAQPPTKQVFINKRPCTATYHKKKGTWVVAYQSESLPIVRNGRRSVVMCNGVELLVEDAR